MSFSLFKKSLQFPITLQTNVQDSEHLVFAALVSLAGWLQTPFTYMPEGDSQMPFYRVVGLAGPFKYQIFPDLTTISFTKVTDYRSLYLLAWSHAHSGEFHVWVPSPASPASPGHICCGSTIFLFDFFNTHYHIAIHNNKGKIELRIKFNHNIYNI